MTFAADQVYLWKGVHYRLREINGGQSGDKMSHWIATRLTPNGGPEGKSVHMPAEADDPADPPYRLTVTRDVWDALTGPKWCGQALQWASIARQLRAEIAARDLKAAQRERHVRGLYTKLRNLSAKLRAKKAK